MNTINPIAQAAQEISGYQQAMRQTGSGTASVQATQLARWRAALEQAIQPQAEALPPDAVRDAAAYHWLTTALTSPEPWVVFQMAFSHMTQERPPTKAELDAAIYAAIAQQKGAT